MNPSKPDFAKIRHELRNPVNHILGYAEILLEDEQVPRSFHADLWRIHSGGKQLLQQINECFDETRSALSHSDVNQLQHDLRTPVNHIRGYAEIIEEQAEELGLTPMIPDLRRIQAAARQWLALMEEQLLPLQSDTGSPSTPLPLTPAISLQTMPPRSASPETFSGNARVLVVDDDAGNRDILVRRLERHGFTTGVAADGLEALRLLRTSPFDLVLLDLLLPGLDGYQVLVRLKADPKLRHLPVLMISGLDQENGIARCIEAGADDYLTKPFNPTLLRARIGACLEKKRLRDQEQATYHALVASQRQLAAELAEAGAYVTSLLPAPLTAGPVTADWCFQSSTQLGGDSFGYHWVNEDHFAIYLLDVCGHGVGAALLSVSALNVLRSGRLLADNLSSPAGVLEALNRMFPMESQNQQYFTCWLGLYSRATGRLSYASAGHPPALLFTPAGRSAELRTVAPPVGAFPEARYLAAEIEVPPGSQLFVFSDGVYEITHPDGRAGTLQEFVNTLGKEATRSDFAAADCLAAAKAAQGTETLGDDYSLIRFRIGADTTGP
jgi:sigma-B regulation protein RsbU (phosphoserine phosphatase)